MSRLPPDLSPQPPPEQEAHQQMPAIRPSLSTSTSFPLPRLTLIVATTPSLGIGHKGTLPWPPLKPDLRFFARVTKRPPPTPPSHNGSNIKVMNAVIMGRKTWESLPSTARPLKGRINVVVSSAAATSRDGTMKDNDTNDNDNNDNSPCLRATGLEAALKQLVQRFPPVTSYGKEEQRQQQSDVEDRNQQLAQQTEHDPSILDAATTTNPATATQIKSSPRTESAISEKDAAPVPSAAGAQINLGRVFIIGGAQLYQAALCESSPLPSPSIPTQPQQEQPALQVERILWTRISKEFECDTWFPDGVLLPSPSSPLEGEGAKREKSENEAVFPVGKGWVKRSTVEMERWVGEEGVGGVKKEGGLEFEVAMVEKESEVK